MDTKEWTLEERLQAINKKVEVLLCYWEAGEFNLNNDYTELRNIQILTSMPANFLNNNADRFLVD